MDWNPLNSPGAFEPADANSGTQTPWHEGSTFVQIPDLEEGFDEDARRLFQILCYMDPSTPVSPALFQAANEEFRDKDGRLKYIDSNPYARLRDAAIFQYAATYLQQRSFVVPKAEGYISHPMITEKYIHEMDLETRCNVFRQAIALVYECTPKSQQEIEDMRSKDWPFLKHTIRLLDLWEDDKRTCAEDRLLSDEPLLAELAGLWAKFLLERGMRDDAIQLLARGFDVAVSISGKSDVEVELKMVMEWMVGLMM